MEFNYLISFKSYCNSSDLGFLSTGQVGQVGGGYPGWITIVYMSSGMFRGKESSNRIEISRLVQDLLNFGVLGSLRLWGGAGGWGLVWGHLEAWGCPHMHAHTCTCTHMHAHTCIKLQMAADMEASMFSMFIMFNMHVHVCMCVCVHGTPPTYPYPPPPPSTHLPPPGGWIPKIS